MLRFVTSSYGGVIHLLTDMHYTAYGCARIANHCRRFSVAVSLNMLHDVPVFSYSATFITSQQTYFTVAVGIMYHHSHWISRIRPFEARRKSNKLQDRMASTVCYDSQVFRLVYE